jgi:hypothetical protein
MAIVPLTDWLEGPKDFAEGVKLYNLYGGNKFLKILFANGENAHSRQKLHEQLLELNRSCNEAPLLDSTLAKAPTGKATHFLRLAVEHDKLPADLQAKNILKGELYREAGKLHSGLLDMKTDDARREAAKTIVENFKEIDGIWVELDRFQSPGAEAVTLKPEEELAMIASDSLITQRNNLRANISKARKKLEGMRDGKAKDNKAAKLESWQKELAEVETKLKFK